jgi:hypothetical protein
MTSYVEITDAEIDVDSPVTQVLMTKYRDNSIAIAEGSDGAPRIKGASIAALSSFPVLSVTASDDFSLGLGETRVSGTSTFSSSTSYQTVATFTINKVTGSIRLSAVISAAMSGTILTRTRILKNGSEIQEFSNTFSGGTGNFTLTFDSTAVPTDVFVWQTRRFDTNSTTGNYFVSASGNTATDGYRYVSPIIAQSDL